MKNVKKLLALLLALVLVFSLVACGGNSSSKSDDDKDDKGSSNVDKNNDKNDDKEDEKEPAKVSDAETVVGTWAYRAEISDTYLELTKTQTGISTLSSDEDIYMDLAVEFKDGKLV